MLLGMMGLRKIWALRVGWMQTHKRQALGIFFGLLAGSVAMMNVWLWQGAMLGWAVVGLGVLTLTWNVRREDTFQRFFLRFFLAFVVAGISFSPFFLSRALRAEHQEESPVIETAAKGFWSGQLPLYLAPPQWVYKAADQGWLITQINTIPLQVNGEFDIFPGYTFWLFLLLAVFSRRGEIRSWHWLLFAGVFLLLSFGPFLRWGDIVRLGRQIIILPGYAMEVFPVLKGYRVFARLSAFALMCGGIFIGLRWRQVFPARRHIRWIAVGALLLGLVAERADFPCRGREVAIPAFFQQLARTEGDQVLFHYPINNWVFALAQTTHEKRVVNFYSSRTTEALQQKEADNPFLRTMRSIDPTTPPWEGPRPEPTTPDALRAAVQSLGVDGVVIHRAYLKQPEEQKALRILTGAAGLVLTHSDPDVLFLQNPQGRDFELPSGRDNGRKKP